MVLKLPPAAQVSKLEARIAFGLTMAHSTLSADLVAPLMYALRVVQQAERKLGDVLDTTKHWINSGDSSCNWHLYPSDFPRRHGHIKVLGREGG
jgi:hypothetical protein